MNTEERESTQHIVERSENSRPDGPVACPDSSTIESLLVSDGPQWLIDHLTDCESCRMVLESLVGGKIRCPEESENLTKRLRNATRDFNRSSAQIGKVIGHYKLLRIIGRGGMGVVFEGLDTHLDRHVAVKTIRPDSLVPELIRRIDREARLQSSLNHPNIVTLHEFGIHDGLPFIVMEMVQGETLKKRIQNRGPLQSKAAATIVQNLARAISYAHGKGVIHRDLKSSNVLLPGEISSAAELGEAYAFDDAIQNITPKITDFGLSVSMVSRTDHSSSDVMPGTLAYMSPEQLDSSSPGVSPSSDIYSLGVILYECLTGHPPFMSGNPALTIRMILQNSPPSPGSLVSGVPRDLETICLKCLEKQPSRRYASAECLADDLKRFLELRPIQARPAGVISKTWRTCRRHPLTASALATSAVSLITLAAVSVNYASKQADLRNLAIDEAFRSRQAEMSARESERIARAAENQAREAETKANRAAQEARLESDHARNNLFMGVYALADVHEKLKMLGEQIPGSKEIGDLKKDSEKAIDSVLLSYINRSDTRGDLNADAIDRLFLDGIAVRDFGDHEKALGVFERVMNLVRKCPIDHPDILRRRAAATRSATTSAMLFCEAGQTNKAIAIACEAWRNWTICPKSQGYLPGMGYDRVMLGKLYSVLLRESGSVIEAETVMNKVRNLNEQGTSLAVQPARGN